MTSSTPCSIGVSRFQPLKKPAKTASAEASSTPSTTRRGTASTRPRAAAAARRDVTRPPRPATRKAGAASPWATACTARVTAAGTVRSRTLPPRGERRGQHQQPADGQDVEGEQPRAGARGQEHAEDDRGPGQGPGLGVGHPAAQQQPAGHQRPPAAAPASPSGPDRTATSVSTAATADRGQRRARRPAGARPGCPAASVERVHRRLLAMARGGQVTCGRRGGRPPCGSRWVGPARPGSRRRGGRRSSGRWPGPGRPRRGPTTGTGRPGRSARRPGSSPPR